MVKKQTVRRRLPFGALSRFLPLRSSLLVIVLLMGVFSLLMVFATAEVYRNLAVENQREALSELAGLKAHELLQNLNEHSQTLGLGITRGEHFVIAFKNSNKEAMRVELESRFHQYFVTAGILKLSKLIALDLDGNVLASATGEDSALDANAEVCPGLVTRAARRRGGARLRAMNELCLYKGDAYSTSIVTIGGIRPIGYLQVITEPAHSLIPIETALGMSITLSNSMGDAQYQSASWNRLSDPDNYLITDYQLKTPRNDFALNVSLQRDMRSFYAELNQTRRLVMIAVAIASLLTAIVVIFVLKRIVLNPLQLLCGQLRQVGRYESNAKEDQSEGGRPGEFGELKELYETLETMALTDPLTGLPNRNHFEHRLDEMIETTINSGRAHAICFLDLDQFKIVNDTCGHIAGDELLRQLSAILADKLRGADMLARLGGDEFGVLLDNCDLPNAQQIATNLQTTVDDFRFSWEEKSFSIGVCIGIVPLTSENTDKSSLLSRADAACYTAKELGRSRIHVAKQDDAEIIQRTGQMQWISRITDSLDHGGFCLFRQLIDPIRAEGLLMPHFEFLLRMVDKDGRYTEPMAFIPAAERYKMMTSIDKWTVKEACTWIANNHEAGIDSYGINLSGQSISDMRFLNYVVEIFDMTDVPADKICFEITETAAMANMTHAIRFISIMKGMGCRFSLDDFGIGLSSFAYLKQLQVDYLKIDGRFIRDIAEDPIARAMVDSINRIGHVMGLRTVAEKVESEDVLERLREIGVDFAQGRIIDRPRPLASVTPQPKKRGGDDQPSLKIVS